MAKALIYSKANSKLALIWYTSLVNAMEKAIKIPLGNKQYIYGTFRGPLKSPLLVFVHGFTGYKDEHIFFNGARFFEKKGFSSFRFDLYNWKKDARKLEDCTLSLHGQDLDTVVEYFRKKGVKKIFVAGHSFGGVTVLLSKKKDFDAAVLWDSTGDKDVKLEAKYIKELDKYYRQESAYGFTISKKMYEENNSKLKPTRLIKSMHMPVKVIVAGAGILVIEGKELFESANSPKDYAIIPKATHNFHEDGTEEILFQETYVWLKKFV